MTHFKTTGLAAAITVSGLAGLAAPAQAADALVPKKPYRAEMVVESAGQTVPMTMYHSKGKMRIEMSPGGQETVQIIDMNSGEAFTLVEVAGSKRAMKLKVDDALSQFGLSDNELGRPTGSQRIARHKCKTYTVSLGTVCLTKHNIALESTSRDGTTRVTKLKIGRQKASLFEVPSDYTVMDMGSFGGLGGFGGEAGGFDADSVLGGLMDSLGIEGDAGDLDVLAGDENGEVDFNAAMEMMMRMGGQSEQQIEAAKNLVGDGDTTTADVLSRSIESELYKNPGDREKMEEMGRENDRLAKIMREEGMAGMLRDQGMSEAEVQKMMGQMAETQAKLAEHVERGRAEERANAAAEAAGNLPTDDDMASIEDEVESFEAKAERVMADGVATEAEKEQLEKEAMDAFKRLMGEK